MLLRPWRVTDHACAERAAADPRFPDRARTEQSLAIARADTDEAVGLVALCGAPQNGVANITYWLSPEHRGRGLATRAVWLVTGHALDGMGMARVQAWVKPADRKPAAVLERCGYLREGLLRSYLVVEGLRVDVHVYSRISD